MPPKSSATYVGSSWAIWPFRFLRRLKLSAAFSEQFTQAQSDPDCYRIIGQTVERALRTVEAEMARPAPAIAAGSGDAIETVLEEPRATLTCRFDDHRRLTGLTIHPDNAVWRFRIGTEGVHFLLDAYCGESAGYRRHSAEVSRDPYLSPFKRGAFHTAMARLRAPEPKHCRLSGDRLLHAFRFVYRFAPESGVDGDCYDMLAKAAFDLDGQLQSLSLAVSGTEWHASIGAGDDLEQHEQPSAVD